VPPTVPYLTISHYVLYLEHTVFNRSTLYSILAPTQSNSQTTVYTPHKFTGAAATAIEQRQQRHFDCLNVRRTVVVGTSELVACRCQTPPAIAAPAKPKHRTLVTARQLASEARTAATLPSRQSKDSGNSAIHRPTAPICRPRNRQTSTDSQLIDWHRHCRLVVLGINPIGSDQL
jgi:hypothetical protein